MPDRYGIFGANADNNNRKKENSDIRYIGQYSIQYAECGYQICVSKICNGGRMSNKLNPNIIVEKSKHFRFYQLIKGLPSAGQIT